MGLVESTEKRKEGVDAVAARVCNDCEREEWRRRLKGLSVRRGSEEVALGFE